MGLDISAILPNRRLIQTEEAITVPACAGDGAGDGGERLVRPPLPFEAVGGDGHIVRTTDAQACGREAAIGASRGSRDRAAWRVQDGDAGTGQRVVQLVIVEGELDRVVADGIRFF